MDLGLLRQLECMDDALQRGRPEIFNTDHRTQFTAKAFTHRLKVPAVRVSMDGRGHALDNVFIERLWRTVRGRLPARLRDG